MGEQSGRTGEDFVYDASREEQLGEGDDPSSSVSSNEGSSFTSTGDDHLGMTNTSDNGGGFGPAGVGGQSADKAFADNLAHTLSRDVRLWRTIVSGMLLATAVLVTVGTYIFLSREETNDFEEAFESTCLELGDIAQSRSFAIANAFDAESDLLTSYVLEVDDHQWPFVTVPHFERRGEHVRRDTQSQVLAFAPLLTTDTDKSQWNTNYSEAQGSHWLQASYAQAIHTAGGPGTTTGDIYSTAATESQQKGIPELVYRLTAADNTNTFDFTAETETTPGPWLPLWQSSPPPPLDPYPINFNLLSSPDVQRIVDYVAEHRVPILTDTLARHPLIRHWMEQYDAAGVTPDHSHSDDHGYDNAKTDHETHNHDDDDDDDNEISTNNNNNNTNGRRHRRRLDHTDENTYDENYVNKEGYMFVVYPVFGTFDDDNDDNGDNENNNANQKRLTTFNIGKEVTTITSRNGTSLTSNTSSSSSSSSNSAAGAGRPLTGIYLSRVRWDWILTDALHAGTKPVLATLKNTCDGDGAQSSYTYNITGMDATFLGIGNVEDVIDGNNNDLKKYGNHEIKSPIKHLQGLTANGEDTCEFFLHVYPTVTFRTSYASDQAIIFTTIVGLAFGMTALFFLFYVRIVQRRQTKVMATAARTNAIVTSLFPSNVRDRIMKDAEDAVNNNTAMMAPFLPGMGDGAKKKLKTFLDEENPAASNDNQLIMFKTKPIADLFPETTVMFADLVGFTAWSSVREPTQVFQLLETIYHSFDEIARRRRVFKVETVGDCYVAVVGLPDPRKDHAVIMARFARDCMQTVNDLTKKLEVTLGPDTGDLQIRIGLHSGPVTAGVLRGEKSRFQLFGDTVNTAARMESTGAPSRIQLSTETADLLVAAGKSNWIRERAEKVTAKGKGELQTFWLEVRHEGTTSVHSGSSTSDLNHDQDDLKMPQPAAKPMKDAAPTARALDAKAKRLVDWNCDQMVRLLKHVVARRNAQGNRRNSMASSAVSDAESEGFRNSNLRKIGTVLEEVREIITLPKFDARVYRNHDDPDSVQLADEVLQQLHDYVSTIATLYRDNPFHNFEHASHVTMSVSKLLSRIVSPQDINRSQNNDANGEQKSEQKIEDYAWSVHQSTYGITSDPLTQFAVVFSALIHDVDHTGVPNATLVNENAKIAELYKEKSVAEQNSVDLAWDMLMDSKYAALQKVLYTNSYELQRFRQLVVNTVMATDIVDKDLKNARNARWDKAFKGVEEDETADINRKATIVIEHLIQASDVAHTMQHWHIFRKWNERLFQEMHRAYREGRAEKDPSEFWFKGEIGFFDFYIIPLAKKLKECGVFGVSSDEYLNYAIKNREEWIVKGNEIVEQMLERVPKKGDVAPIVPETAP